VRDAFGHASTGEITTNQPSPELPLKLALLPFVLIGVVVAIIFGLSAATNSASNAEPAPKSPALPAPATTSLAATPLPTPRSLPTASTRPEPTSPPVAKPAATAAPNPLPPSTGNPATRRPSWSRVDPNAIQPAVSPYAQWLAARRRLLSDLQCVDVAEKNITLRTGAAIQVGAAELDFYGRPRMPLSFGLGKCYLAPEAVLQMDRDALITQP